MFQVSETRRVYFQYKSLPRIFFDVAGWSRNNLIGAFVAMSISTWFLWKSNLNQTSMRNFFNEKLLKYIPIEHGGNFFFPFSMYSLQYDCLYPKTQWSSFDKRSFFPHTDRFKMKVAIAHEDFFLINTLLDREFEVDSFVDQEKKLTPLALASLLGKHEVVEYLCARGADLEIADFEGNTPLMLAVVYDHPKTVQRLVSLGADLSKKDVYGFGFIEKAENRGNTQLAEFLKEVRQQPKVPNVKPFTHRLESYDFLQVNKAKEVIEKYDIEKYFRPIAYPYYKSSKGFLVYLFPAIDAEDIELHVSPSVYFNPKDDKITSDQDLFTFGEIAKERMGMLKE